MYKNDDVDNAKLGIDSMLKQTVKTNDFVLIVDGPLTCAQEKMIAEYERKNECFRVIRLKRNVGLGKALAIGVDVCKNEMIARMDNDDIALPNRCEKQLNFFKQRLELDVLGTNVIEFEKNPKQKKYVKKMPITSQDVKKYAKLRNPINHSSVMFKKSSIIDAGNYSSMRTNQDVELWVRMINKGFVIENMPEELVYFRMDKDTYQRRKNKENIELLLEVWFQFYKKGYCSLIDYLLVFFIHKCINFFPLSAVHCLYGLIRK